MWLLICSHEVGGDSVGAAGDGFELHPLQVHVFGQTPLQHVSYHHTLQRGNIKMEFSKWQVSQKTCVFMTCF